MSSNEIVQVTMDQMQVMAKTVASSKLFGVQTTEQAMALMLISQADGLHPMQAIKRYHIIQGKPALRADAMLAQFQQRGGKVEWHKRDAAEVSATFISAGCPKGVTITWRMSVEAKQAGLCEKDNWKKYPRQMLTARVISEGVRASDPGIVEGIYTPEEMQDMAPTMPVQTLPRPTVVDTVAEVIEEKPQPKTEVKKAAPQPSAAPNATVAALVEMVGGEVKEVMEDVFVNDNLHLLYIEDIATVAGEKNGKKWERYDIKTVDQDGSEITFKTFSRTLADTAAEYLKANALFEYDVVQRGRWQNYELKSIAAAPEA